MTPQLDFSLVMILKQKLVLGNIKFIINYSQKASSCFEYFFDKKTELILFGILL